MGKSKKRIFHKGINDRLTNLSRERAVRTAAGLLKAGDREAYNLITLFGMTAEELLEAGAPYEIVKSLDNMFK